MVSRAQRTPFGEWWWTVDRLTIGAIGTLMLAGVVLSLAIVRDLYTGTELARVLAQVRTGTPIARAFDELATRSGLAVVSRFAEGIAIAVERGTPLADVLHAQAGDVREAGRRALFESGARREVLMMVPVVFLVLPVVVVFAFWPGLVGLRLVVP